MPEGGAVSAVGAISAAGAFERLPLRVHRLGLAAVLACALAMALGLLAGVGAPSTHAPVPGARVARHASFAVAPSLLASASPAMGASDRSYWAVQHGGALSTKGGGIGETYSAAGVDLRVPQGTLALWLSGVGRGGRVGALATTAPTGAANQVLYRRGGISERYRNGPYGLEQSFAVASRPSGEAGPLVIELRVGGSLVPSAVGSQIRFRTRAGATALSYGELGALDATGRRLPARMEIRGGRIDLLIADAGARYPLAIDPFFQRGAKFTAGEELGNGAFGGAIAMSADGNTAVVGGGGDNSGVGAAWVFTRSGTTWTQQGPKLTGSGEIGKAQFGGYGVALSGDGNTALIGAGSDNGEVGAAWVFVRSGSTWTQQGSKLTGGGEAGRGHFGFRVALSADGSSALIAAPEDNTHMGAAWSFVRTGSTWEQQGEKLTGSGELGGGELGVGLALSADGNTALIGAGADNGGQGAAWAFVRSGVTWEQQGAKLTGEGEVGNGHFGFRTALSENGNTALIGGGSDNAAAGAAWVFTRSGTTWEQQGEKLTGGEEVGGAHFGYSDALSADGNTALIGGLLDNSGAGAAWAFTRSGSTWAQLGPKLTGAGESGGGDFGTALALSADGSTALIGAPADHAEVGAAWTFLNTETGPPTVTSVAPSSGTTLGGTAVTISGTGFVAPATVTIGGAATSVNVVSPTEITAQTASSPAGPQEVVVTDANGTSVGGATYTYLNLPPPVVKTITPVSGTTLGGTLVKIKGSGFLAGATVTIGNAATSVTVVSATEVTARTAATSAGAHEVVVHDANGTSTAGPSYTYVTPPLPVVKTISPTTGTTAGGTTVTIAGTGFMAPATVTIGNAATSVTVASSTKITAHTAATAAGAYTVVVSGPNGTSTGGPSFTYVTAGRPTVASVTPNSGPVAGGSTVTIKGANLGSASPVVDFGSNAASVISESATSIVAQSPPAAATGIVHVTVTTAGGTSATSSKDQFNYLALPTVTSVTPASGPTAGGTTVAIKGSGFVAGATVAIGSAASEVVVVSPTEITAKTTATAAGTHEVVVKDAGGTSSGGPSFTYLAPPTVTSISPTSGPAAGGTSVTITGTGFLTGASVTIGSAATEVFVVSETELIAATSATAVGSDPVVVSDLNGTSTGGPSFTYE